MTTQFARTVSLSQGSPALPQILSREKVAAIFENITNVKQRALLMTTYGAGLRLSEACHPKVGDIDCERMTIRAEQGKSAKDRYTLLSPGLLKELTPLLDRASPAVLVVPESTQSTVAHAAQECGSHLPRSQGSRRHHQR